MEGEGKRHRNAFQQGREKMMDDEWITMMLEEEDCLKQKRGPVERARGQTGKFGSSFFFFLKSASGKE